MIRTLASRLRPRPAYAPALLAVALAGGCAVGPDYQTPQISMPENWSAADLPAATQPSATTQPAVDLAVWWTAFQDPQLDSLVQRAVASNLDLRQAEARIRQARANRGVVAAAFWPTADATGSVTRSRTPTNSDIPGAPSGVTSNLFRAGFDASWELDVFGGARRGIESAEASIGASLEDRRDVLVTLLGEVALDYVQLRAFQQQLRIVHDNLRAQQKTADLTHKRIVAGIAAALDEANAKAQVATTSAQIPVLESSIRQTIHALSILLGREPGALVAELSPEGPIPGMPAAPLVPIGLPSDLLRRRPDIRRAERQLAAATAQIGVATADLFPKFSLTGSLGLENNKFRPLWNWSSNFWSIGPSVSWPIFDAGKVRANIHVQNALTDQALTTYEQAVLNAMQDVENALVAYTKELDHRKALSEAVDLNLKAVDIATRLYTQGLTDFLNVLVTQNSLYAAQNALVQSDGALSADLVALYKALGGGWETMDDDLDPPAPQPQP